MEWYVVRKLCWKGAIYARHRPYDPVAVATLMFTIFLQVYRWILNSVFDYIYSYECLVIIADFG